MLQDLYLKGKVGQVLLIGREYHEAGQLPQAEACYMRALEMDPDNAAAHYNLGNIHLRQG